jgi:hypothetical protein
MRVRRQSVSNPYANGFEGEIDCIEGLAATAGKAIARVVSK